tara:strand:+ start:1220 stop:1402 length:183 start_codon:yes stop_codon:yes gene_type:complete
MIMLMILVDFPIFIPVYSEFRAAFAEDSIHRHNKKPRQRFFLWKKEKEGEKPRQGSTSSL